MENLRNDENAERRRRRDSGAPRGGSGVAVEDDRPMSHEEYVQKRRRETSTGQVYQELTPDVLAMEALLKGMKRRRLKFVVIFLKATKPMEKQSR
ncbi:uncharacterized protein LOC120292968 isoform X2 [Eucalyptus grandis]|uniref:uncharacterized protein LOC120292968 isoform X2 n=1 Tax=Eucalyptus grandis TaxID=71139 RepID=UPI00192ECC8E|nr:uncharacterized protein LOC120292968 isoform X2 [Eucalyptus grandis]XP_039167541.1 uncharacterized protein LOC120292968 isoform X2 [Eucalyptus grandis]XP_039167542.1 uncharacterized protein LOC120292968 isoform X2 [Eucalyptus grandis]